MLSLHFPKYNLKPLLYDNCPLVVLRVLILILISSAILLGEKATASQNRGFKISLIPYSYFAPIQCGLSSVVPSGNFQTDKPSTDIENEVKNKTETKYSGFLKILLEKNLCLILNKIIKFQIRACLIVGKIGVMRQMLKLSLMPFNLVLKFHKL